MSDPRRIVEEQLYCHFVTVSCDPRTRLLDEVQPKRILLGQLNDQLRRHNAGHVGFVVMPDHVHAIVWSPQTRQLSRFMHGWKRLSSYAIRRWYRQQKANDFRVADPGDPLWTPKHYAFELYSRRKLAEKLNYMHLNPVRVGLVEKLFGPGCQLTWATREERHGHHLPPTGHQPMITKNASCENSSRMST